MALVKNAADELQVKEARALEKVSQEIGLKGVSAMMGSKDARGYIFELIEFCGVFKTSFSIDNRIYFNEGQRNVGLKLIADIQQSCPDLYVKMMNEAKGE